jgi:DNA-binding GntR family transcriptional regulator
MGRALTGGRPSVKPPCPAGDKPRRRAARRAVSLAPLPGGASRKSLGEEVFEHLRRAIIEGELPPGQRLVESRIAAALGISRTPVREALHKLDREGFLRKQPRGGFTVPALSRREIEETFGIRSVLESYAARLAALEHSAEELEPLLAKVDAYQAALKQGRLEVLPRINTEFHDLLYALSRSTKLVKMINDLRDQIYRFRQMILKRPEMARISHRDHREMLAAIGRRDAEGVEKLVREHILRGQKAVLETLDL